MNNFKKLIVWQKARVFVKDMYLITKKFPREELFGLTSQIRRATVSIALNIAEGSGRGTNADFVRFLDIAYGSAFEVEATLILSLDLEFITNDEYEILDLKIQEIQKMISKLAESIRHETNRHETNRHEINRHETNRHETNRHETNRLETNRHETNRLETNRHETNRNET